jgi:DNA repair protein RadC
MEKCLDNISDDDLRAAYHARFRIKAGQSYSNSQQVADHLVILLEGKKRETFVVMYLNQRNALIDSEVIFEGTVNHAVVYPREIVKSALLKDSSAIICGHNHPSGAVKPSSDDQAITRKIKEACDTIDVRLLDHIIIANGEFFSFADSGLL